MKTSAVYWLSSLCLMTVLSADSDSEISYASKKHSKQKDVCGRAPQHMRVAVRYDSPKGIGYNEGYSTLEGFFSPPLLDDAWLPFVDVRGHVFDSGKWAANAGLGLRYLSSSRVWGFNGYYDYRNTSRRTYNQVGVGLETLGTVWDFRLNGYLPVGKTHTSIFHSKFDKFKGHFMLLDSTRQFALKGLNGEVGYHLDHFKNAPLYFAAGPYYLTGKGASTWGGELRARVDLFHRYVRLEAKTAYDHFFKWTGQGEVSVNVSFGGRAQVKKRGNNSCPREMTLAQRIVQPVDRAEIIPVGKQHLTSPAINPATGQPFFFIFVNNTSHSLGTFESPYPNFDLVESASTVGSIIYVYPGNGSAYDTSTEGTLMAGLTLQDSQQLLGAATAQTFTTTLGTFTVPPQAPTGSLPILTSTFSAGNVVTLGNNNTISGFYVAGGPGGGDDIIGTSITNFTSAQNTIVGNGGNGISLFVSSGQVVFSNNTFFNVTNGINIPTDALGTLNVSGCSFSACGNNAIFIDVPSSVGSMNVSGCTFINNNTALEIRGWVGAMNLSGTTFLKNSNAAIDIGGTIGTLNIANCDISKTDGTAFSLDGSSSVGTMTITDSTFTDNSGNGIYIAAAIANSLTISGVTSANNQAGGLDLSGASIPTVNISGCNFNSSFNNNGMSIENSSTIGNITITGCDFSSNRSNGGLSTSGGTTINSMTISDSNFNFNDQNGLNIGGTLNSFLSISGCSFNGNDGIGINFDPSNTLDSLTITGCSISENDNGGLLIGSGTTITNVVISGSEFSANNNNGVDFQGSSTVTNLTLSGCTINYSNSNNLSIEGGSTITTFNISDNSFNYSSNNGITADFTNSTSGTISNNSFIFNNDNGLEVENTCNLVVTGNTFESNYNTTTLGYGAAIYLTTAGPICLQFANNYANPPMSFMPSAYTPYLWDNSGVGVFNITADSTQANNYGVIQQMNISGTCQ